MIKYRGIRVLLIFLFKIKSLLERFGKRLTNAQLFKKSETDLSLFTMYLTINLVTLE